MVYTEKDINEVIFLSDIHFGVHANDLGWLDDTVGYFENFFFPFVRSEIISGYNPAVIIAGDYFDNRHLLDVQVMHSGMDVMQKLSELVPVYIMVGNHDIYSINDNYKTSLRIFSKFRNVHVTYERDQLIIAGGKKFDMIAWVGDHVKETKMISESDADFVVLHTEISGMKMDKTRPIINGVNCDAFSKKIYSGHIHIRQSNGKITYLGSPFGTTKTDCDNIKGIYYLTVDGDEVTENFEENTYSPKFVSYTYDELCEHPELVANNYVYFTVKDTETKHINYAKFLNRLLEYKYRKIFINEVKTEVVRTDENTVTKEATVNEIIEQTINSQELSDDDKKKLVELDKYYNNLAVNQ